MKNRNKTTCVYILIDTLANEPLYVGHSADADLRIRQHLRYTQSSTPMIAKRIMRIKKKGGDVIALKVFQGANIEARNKENEAIRMFLEAGFVLENCQYRIMVSCGGTPRKYPAKKIKKYQQ